MAAFFGFCSAGLLAGARAEKVDVKFTKNARATYAEAKTSGAAGREIAQYFYVDKINMSQGLDFVEEWACTTETIRLMALVRTRA